MQRKAAVCLPFILTRGLLWFLPEQSRTNGRDTRVPEALQCKQFELANTPMKSELYLGLDVDKEWIVISFRYKHELDPDRIPQFGLVAEEVEKVNPDLVVRDENGDLSSVRYEAVNAMLLNEFLKEHQTVRELKKQVTELTAGLQKLSAQLELNKPAPQTVLNNR